MSDTRKGKVLGIVVALALAELDVFEAEADAFEADADALELLEAKEWDCVGVTEILEMTVVVSVES